MLGISFLSPAFLLGALVAALPIALHLIGHRPQIRVMFPAVRLLKQSPAEETRRRRLADLLVLALRVAAIVLLALAFARPYLLATSHDAAPDTLIVALDRSFSMSAPGQFSRAIAAAQRIVRNAGAHVRVGLAAFDDDAVILVEPTEDRGAVLRAIGRVQPGYGGTSYGAALARASEALGQSAGRLVVVTDLQRSGWSSQAAAISERVRVSVEDVGGLPGNLAVGDLHRTATGMAATIRNSGPAPKTGKARLFVAGRLRGLLPYSLDGGAVQQLLFPASLPATGDAMVEIDDPTGCQADNRAYAVLDPPAPPSLLAITADGDASRGSFYLQRALEVDGGKWFRLDTVSASTFSVRTGGGGLRGYTGLFLLGTRGLAPSAARAIAEYVKNGGGLFVALDDKSEPPAIAQVLEHPITYRFESTTRADEAGITTADSRHPVMQPLGAAGLAGVRLERIARFSASGLDVIARFADGRPALVEERLGGGRVLLFGSDLSKRWNDLPLQPVFLPLVHRVARYLAAGRGQVQDWLVRSLPPGFERRPGIVTLPAEAAASGKPVAPRRIAVNVDPRESDISHETPAEFEQAIARTQGTLASGTAFDPRGAKQQGWWRAVLALVVAALMAESLVARRLGLRRRAFGSPGDDVNTRGLGMR